MRKKERNAAHLIFLILITAFVLIIADLIVFAGLFSKWKEDIPFGSQTIMENLTYEAGEYSLSEDVRGLLEKDDLFAFIISENGSILWEERLPEELEKEYTMKDVALFTRYYLDDYPVHTYVIPEGLLIIGSGKHTTWKYTLEYNEGMVRQFIRQMPVLMIINLVLLIAVPLFVQRKWIKSREAERTEWIAGVSHDIRTPLTLILGNADYISKNTEDMAVREKADQTIKQGVKIRTLVANLNTSSKVVFAGEDTQNISFDSPANSGFNDVEFVNKDVKFLTAMKGWTLQQDTEINTDLKGLNGTLDLNGHALSLNGDFVQTGGTVNINKGKLIVNGNYEIEAETYDETTDKTNKTNSAGVLAMTNASDQVIVNGDFVMHSNNSHSGRLTAGEMYIKGNFDQINGNSSNFKATGTHTVILNGTPLQTVSFDSEYSSFCNLKLVNGKDAYHFSREVCWTNLEQDLKVDSVKVTPVQVSVEQGAEQQFEAEIQGDGTVEWSVEGNTSTLTTISSNGLLEVAEDELAEKLTVKATSVIDDTKSATAEVTVTKAQNDSTEDDPSETDTHVHTYNEVWESDADYHWHSCECGEKSNMEEHTFIWVIDKAATADEEGMKHEECQVCGYKQNEETVIEKVEPDHVHVYEGDWMSDGEGHWKLCDCGESSEHSLHEYGDWVVVQESACTEEGVRTKTCSVCGYVLSENMEAQGHNLVERKRENATCERLGHEAYYECTNCGKLFRDLDGTSEVTMDDLVLEMTEHTWDEGVVTREATATTEGIRTYTCTVCGKTRTETIPVISDSDEKDTESTENGEETGENTEEKKQQKITGTDAYVKTYGDGEFNLDIKLVEGNGRLTYVSSDEDVITVSSTGQVEIKGAGMADISVVASATEDFEKAEFVISVTVEKALRTMEGTASYSKKVSDDPFVAAVELKDDEGTLFYTSLNERVAAVTDDGYITIKDAGEVIITVTVPATANYKIGIFQIKLTITADDPKEESSETELSTERTSETSGSTEQNVETGETTEKNTEESVSTEQGSEAEGTTEKNEEVSTSTEQGSETGKTTEKNTDTSTSTEKENEAGKTTEEDTEATTSTESEGETGETTGKNTDASTSTEKDGEVGETTEKNTDALTGTEKGSEAGETTEKNEEVSTSVEKGSEAGETTEKDSELSGNKEKNSEPVQSNTDSGTSGSSTVDKEKKAGENGTVNITSDREGKSTAPNAGTILKDSVSGGTYKVISKAATVEYTAPTNKKVKSVTIPATVTIDNTTYKVTKIADTAFKNNKYITKVTIGSNITVIGKNAFSGCSKLKTVTIGKDVSAIGDKAFYKCSALTKATIPVKVNKIGKQAFYGCKKLKNITIKTTSLTNKSVGKQAFKGIHAKAVIKVPKKKLALYKTILKKKGVTGKRQKIK